MGLQLLGLLLDANTRVMNKNSFDLPAARILHCTEEEYFADPCATPSLTQSIANILLSKSPLHAWSAHPRLGAAPVAEEGEDADDEEDAPRPSWAQDSGHIVHALMLGKGVAVEVIPFDNFKKKAAQEARDAARAAGRVPIIAAKYDVLVRAAERLRERLAAAGYPLDGESEVAIEWHERGEHGPVVCRCRMDHVFLDAGIIYDIKHVRSAHPEKVERTFVDYGYDIQAHAYSRALTALRPEHSGRVNFTFLFLESTAPCAIVPAVPDGPFSEIGRLRWERAVKLWERCLLKQAWPSYTTRGHVAVLEAPAYVVQRELGNVEDL